MHKIIPMYRLIIYYLFIILISCNNLDIPKKESIINTGNDNFQLELYSFSQKNKNGKRLCNKYIESLSNKDTIYLYGANFQHLINFLTGIENNNITILYDKPSLYYELRVKIKNKKIKPDSIKVQIYNTILSGMGLTDSVVSTEKKCLKLSIINKKQVKDKSQKGVIKLEKGYITVRNSTLYQFAKFLNETIENKCFVSSCRNTSLNFRIPFRKKDITKLLEEEGIVIQDTIIFEKKLFIIPEKSIR